MFALWQSADASWAFAGGRRRDRHAYEMVAESTVFSRAVAVRSTRNGKRARNPSTVDRGR
jgi:hypothetical protein